MEIRKLKERVDEMAVTRTTALKKLIGLLLLYYSTQIDRNPLYFHQNFFDFLLVGVLRVSFRGLSLNKRDCLKVMASMNCFAE